MKAFTLASVVYTGLPGIVSCVLCDKRGRLIAVCCEHANSKQHVTRVIHPEAASYHDARHSSLTHPPPLRGCRDVRCSHVQQLIIKWVVGQSLAAGAVLAEHPEAVQHPRQPRQDG